MGPWISTPFNTNKLGKARKTTSSSASLTSISRTKRLGSVRRGPRMALSDVNGLLRMFKASICERIVREEGRS